MSLVLIPTKRRRLSSAQVTKHYQAGPLATAIDKIEEAAGGRSGLLEALSGLPASDDLAYVFGLIAAPDNDARKLSELCHAGDVSLGELLEALKKGVHARALVQAALTIAQHTPAVVADVMTRAQPHFVVCATCRGEQTVRDQEFTPDRKKGETFRTHAPRIECEACRGTGKVETVPDIDHQKLALDLAQLLPGKSPLVTVDNRKLDVHTHAGPTAQSFGAHMAAVDQILHRSGRALPDETDDVVADGDVVEADPAP